MTGTAPAAAPRAAAAQSPRIELRRDDGLGADALAMSAESAAALASIYRPEVRRAFSPAQLVEAGVVCLTAHPDGRLVGCGGRAPGVVHGEPKRISVARAARGRRIADVITGLLEDEARSRGLPPMSLETGDAGPEAIRACRRLGYRRCDPFGDRAENGSSVLMAPRAQAGSAGPA